MPFVLISNVIYADFQTMYSTSYVVHPLHAIMSWLSIIGQNGDKKKSCFYMRYLFSKWRDLVNSWDLVFSTANLSQLNQVTVHIRETSIHPILWAYFPAEHSSDRTENGVTQRLETSPSSRRCVIREKNIRSKCKKQAEWYFSISNLIYSKSNNRLQAIIKILEMT